MKPISSAVFVALLITIPPVQLALAATIHVPTDQPTIQDGINAAVDGDIVLVFPGTYMENIDFLGKAITVQSEDGADVTTIDGGQTGSVVTFSSGETEASFIDGFTIRNGTGTYYETPPGLWNYVGGGIFCLDSSPTISNCTISGNTADLCGGIGSEYSFLTITNSTISGNSADFEGGGICFSQSEPRILHSTISDNSAGSAGGGILCVNSDPIITNCILWGDSAPHEPEFYVLSGSPVVTYSDVQGGWSGEGNIDADPLFAGGEDFHLTLSSPCIDSGTDAGVYMDLDGEVRPLGAGFDMGADEYPDCWDGDMDGFGDIACGGNDCDDSDSDINPVADEICDNGIDDDCDGFVDTYDTDCGECDDDDDGYVDEECGGDDCNDGDLSIHPGAEEICTNRIDDDCDGLVDYPDDPDCKFISLELKASYWEGTLSLEFTLGTLESVMWTTYLILTYPTFQVIHLWTVPLPVIDPPVEFPVSFPLPDVLGKVGIWTGLFAEGGAKAVDLAWDDTYQSILPPIVFVSRPHNDTIIGAYGDTVGPLIEVEGREYVVPGGALMLRNSDGTVENLTAGTQIIDAKQPGANDEGTKIVFSGAEVDGGEWRIYEYDLVNRTVRQVTFRDRAAKIPEDPYRPGANQWIFGRYSDFSPIYLTDGRILFASSRYMSQSESCARKALNLYIVNPDGTDLHRVTTERAGAINPWLLENGMVLYSHWFDNLNMPRLDGPGLEEPLLEDEYLQRSLWIPWVMNPDGTDEGRDGFLLGGLDDGYGSPIQMRSLPDGDVVYTYRADRNLLGHTLLTSIARFTPGFVESNSIEGIGDPMNLEADHALCPTPLQDGRILFSYTPDAKVEIDERGRMVADFDYGLYICNGDFTGMKKVYDNPGTEELYPIALYPRYCEHIADTVPSVPLSDNPEIPSGYTCNFTSLGLYADVPLTVAQQPSPMVGTITEVEFFNDRQQFETSEDFPWVSQQMAFTMGNFPVGTGGTFDAEVASDMPVFYILKTVTGVAARQALSPTQADLPAESITYLFGNDWLRPGKRFTCTGCHLGHMIVPSESFRARPNVARFAEASASSSQDDFHKAPWRVKDVRMTERLDRFLWMSGPGDQSPWVQLTWQEPLPVFGLRLYLPPAEWFPPPLRNFETATITFSDGSTLPLSVPQDLPPYLDVTFEEKSISWLRIETTLPPDAIAAVSEIAVHGDHGYVLPDLAPDLPQGLSVMEELKHLFWSWDTHGTTLGYRVHVRREGEPVAEVFDVGNVNHYQLRNLESATRYRVALEPYNVHGNSHGIITEEVEVTTGNLTIESIYPNEGPRQGTPVTVKGSGFVPWSVHGVVQTGTRLVIGPCSPWNLEVVDENTLTGVAPPQRPGIYDVVVSNPYGPSVTLEDAYRYTCLVDVTSDKELYSMGEILRIERVLANEGEEDLMTVAVVYLQENDEVMYTYDGEDFKAEVTYLDWFLPAGLYEESIYIERKMGDPFVSGSYYHLGIVLFDPEMEKELDRSDSYFALE